METYHPVKLGLTRPQVMKLARGEKAQVAPHQMGCGSVHFLTKAQVRKLHTAHKKGKGVRLHFTHHQVRHHLMHGGGFWDTLKSGASALFNVAKPLINKVAKKGVSALTGRFLPPGIAQAVGNEIGNSLIDKATGGRILTGKGFHTYGRGTYI